MEPKNANANTFLIVGHGMPDIHHTIPEIDYNPTFKSEPNKIIHACPIGKILRVSTNPTKSKFPFLRTACEIKGFPLDLIHPGYYLNPMIFSELYSHPLDGIYECRDEGPVRLYKFRNPNVYQLKDLVEFISRKHSYKKIVFVACRGNDNNEIHDMRGNNWKGPLETEPAEYIDCPSIVWRVAKNAMDARTEALSYPFSQREFLNVPPNAKRQKTENHKKASNKYTRSINRLYRSRKRTLRRDKYGLTPREKLKYGPQKESR